MYRSSLAFDKSPGIQSKVAWRVFKRRLALERVMAARGVRLRTHAYLAELQRMDFRTRVVIWIFLVAAALLAWRACFVAMSPTYRVRAALIEANLQPKFMDPLRVQVRDLQALSQRLERVSIGELRSALERTAGLTEQATREFELQYASWTVLRGQIKNDGSSYDALRVQLADVQNLHEKEIQRLRAALDLAAKPSVWSDIWTTLLSFVLGIASSILATMTWERWPHVRAWWRSQASPRFPRPSAAGHDRAQGAIPKRGDPVQPS